MNNFLHSKSVFIAGSAILVVAAFFAGMSFDKARRANETARTESPEASDEGHSHSHGSEEHEHGGHEHAHSEENSLELSETGARNIGLTPEYLKPIELTTYDRTISVPSIVVDRPGRTKLQVSAAMTGLITHVHAVSGEAIESGELLVEMRLTHEDLVTLQKEYLQSLGERDVELKEIARLEAPAASGAISPRSLLERQYSRDKLESLIRSQREALKLHGLNESQLQIIDTERRLLTEANIFAPSPDNHGAEELQLNQNIRPSVPSEFRAASTRIPPRGNAGGITWQDNKLTGLESPQKHLLIVQNLSVQKGQIVNAGELLCTLADYDSLLIEGQAFETEARLIADAKSKGQKVSAALDGGSDAPIVSNLEFAWIDNEVNPATRTLKFYVQLPNVIRSDTTSPQGQRFIEWEYRPGQRMQLNVPVETWTDQIVLPVDGVVREGVDSYIFRQNGDHFDRVPVHERFRDTKNVVIENDGSLFPDDIVATRGAHQMQMALKNKAGGGIDPHAGHNH